MYASHVVEAFDVIGHVGPDMRPKNAIEHVRGWALEACFGRQEDVEFGAADDETEILEQATDLVLEIALDLDQQRPICQQSSDRVVVEILDAHLLEP